MNPSKIATITALHGMLGEPSDWDFLRPILGPGYPVEAHDLFAPDWGQCLDDIGSKINASSSGDFLLGYSMGARLALHALTEQPNRWRAAILISTHPGLAPEDRTARLLADQTWAQKARTGNWSDFLDRWNNQAVFADAVSPDRSRLESKREYVAAAFDRWSLALQEDLLPKLSNIPTPTLYITGEADKKFTDLAARACAISPGATHKIIPGAGHRPHLENRPRFLTELRRFLERQRLKT